MAASDVDARAVPCSLRSMTKQVAPEDEAGKCSQLDLSKFRESSARLPQVLMKSYEFPARIGSRVF